MAGAQHIEWYWRSQAGARRRRELHGPVPLPRTCSAQLRAKSPAAARGASQLHPLSQRAKTRALSLFVVLLCLVAPGQSTSLSDGDAAPRAPPEQPGKMMKTAPLRYNLARGCHLVLQVRAVEHSLRPRARPFRRFWARLLISFASPRMSVLTLYSYIAWDSAQAVIGIAQF